MFYVITSSTGILDDRIDPEYVAGQESEDESVLERRLDECSMLMRAAEVPSVARDRNFHH